MADEKDYGAATDGAHVKKVELEGHEEDWVTFEKEEEKLSEKGETKSSGAIDYTKL